MGNASGKGPVFGQRGQTVGKQVNVAGDYYEAQSSAASGEEVDTDRTCKVFISSTHLDNQERRKVVVDAILRAGMVPVGDHETADTRHSVDACLDKVREADVLVGVIGWRYG
jgi:hypothetical protein